MWWKINVMFESKMYSSIDWSISENGNRNWQTIEEIRTMRRTIKHSCTVLLNSIVGLKINKQTVCTEFDKICSCSYRFGFVLWSQQIMATCDPIKDDYKREERKKQVRIYKAKSFTALICRRNAYITFCTICLMKILFF